MSRVKGGTKSHRNHKKILDLAKGYRMTRRKNFGSAMEAVLHAGEYAFAGRKDKKSNFRTLWIIRMNSALRELGTTYSKFINQLKTKNIILDRKILAKLAVEERALFDKIVAEVSK